MQISSFISFNMTTSLAFKCQYFGAYRLMNLEMQLNTEPHMHAYSRYQSQVSSLYLGTYTKKNQVSLNAFTKMILTSRCPLSVQSQRESVSDVRWRDQS